MSDSIIWYLMGEKSTGASPSTTTMWSLNLQQDENPIHPAHTDNSSISSSKPNLYRYLPNEHHRILASAALDYHRNLAHCPERIVVPSSANSSPMLSRNSVTDQHSSLEATLDHNAGCQNNNLSCKKSSRWAVGVSAKNGLASPDMRIPSDICNINVEMDKSSAFGMPTLPHFTNHSCKYSLASDNDNLAVNSGGSYHCSDMQTEEQLLSISRNKAISSNVDMQSYTSSKEGCLSGGLITNNLVQQSCLRSHTSHSQVEEHQTLSMENSIDDRYASVEERGSSNLNCPSEMNNSIKLENTSIEPFEASSSPNNPPPNVSSDIKDDKPTTCLSGTKQKEIERVILLYEHVRNCQYEGQECLTPRCMELKKVFSHVLNCRDQRCNFRCYRYNQLIHHYNQCRNITCSICGPVRRKLNEDFQKSDMSAGWKSDLFISDSIEDEQPIAKRIKASQEAQPASEQITNFQVIANSLQLPQVVAQPYHEQIRPLGSETNTGQQLLEQSKPSTSSEFANICDRGNKDEDLKFEMKMEVSSPSPPVEAYMHSLQGNIIRNEFSTARMDVRCKINSSTAHSISVSEKEGGKKNVASLLHTFTSQKIKEHIKSLGMDQDKSKADNGQIKSDCFANMNLCSLCGTDKLLFAPLPKYCASCLKIINPKGVYYSVKSDSSPDHEDNSKIFFCGKCYGTSGESIKFLGKPLRKANLERSWNYAEDAESEWFVQCDKCNAWQHTICALFNREMKEELQGEYTCANCFLQELESGKSEPLQKKLVLGAKDLPKTALSNYIEKWVFYRLQKEREQRARSLGKSAIEVPTAEGLAIRVVSSINKKLDVNPLFREIFVDENYPSKFPYKSKVILLFQNIEGSDVCLYAMYVQEYGSECPQPNQRRLCISYIDSVKFFRPEVKAVTGEALRTFVYHEIMIGYLDYSKKRGFTSCYIWSCPPEREDYYIFYCHPKKQKSPKPDKLREWYQSMIRKAMKENIVLEKTNLHEHFFVLASECKAKVTAARLPYFDSDYWPGQAELLLKKDNENYLKPKGTKAVIERALRAAKRVASTGNTKDIILMHQLGEKFQKMKEDYIVVHLQPECRHCCQPLVCGKQWFCNTCKNFQLCEQCHDKELKLENKDKHPVAARFKHSFRLVETNIIGNTADKDEIMKNDYFDTRTEFLSLCKSKHYQFDSLRRAKHSTMMILYHLYRSMNLLSSCAACHIDVIMNGSWHCTFCSGYVICASCFHEHGSSIHEHKLISRSTSSNRVLAGKEGNGELKKQLLDALLHASKCVGCTYPGCWGMKRLFHHCTNCTTRQHGGCLNCQKVWSILLAHSRACRDLDCCVPRCRDLKNRKAQAKPDSHLKKPAKDKIGQQNGEVSEQHT